MASTTAKRKTTKPIKNKSTEPKWEEVSGSEQLRELAHANEIHDIPLSKIRPHANNRKLWNDNSIDELAESIHELGQLEPATVRATNDSKYPYELLSGERRFRALGKLGKTSIRATIVSEETPDALVRMAAANSNRRDLDPIERAELIVLLMQPIEQGGSGLNRLAAGKAVGFQSESGTKNALRMLRLPKSIRDMVKNGKLSERAARKLIPFVDHDEFMSEIESELRDDDSRADLIAEEGWPYWLERLFDQHTRPMDERERSTGNLVQGYWGHHKMLFTPTEEQMVQLVPATFSDNGEKMVVTFNCDLWDELQKPLVKRIFEKRNRLPNGKVSAGDIEKPLSSEDKAAEESSKRIEANKRLKDYSAKWGSMALRLQLTHSALGADMMTTFPFLLRAYLQSNRFDHLADWSFAECDIETKPIKGAWGPPAKMPITANTTTIVSMWRLMLWPVSSKERSPEGLSAKGELPDLEKLPHIQDHLVKALAKRCSVGMIDFWREAQQEQGPQKQLLGVWLGRHTTEQLLKLCTELKLQPSVSKKSELVEFVLRSHDSKKSLSIPKAIA
ncbi:Nucleoid occlusion protein [Pirellula sp. SH-Sr6A]|uniref:ParB/RepB/Spo0J family partition protein n=1 Tax=Pirellula sp. SH-Sr6A TaxID=1632865 RepID=UPI00078E2E9E|nr:ParB/RepB/Spo0J family partition protein [Pirellula sp. SH-Sr6A]AMV34555.1 Nucleoid occlusion protein [Pirellula sp. SH-Sr6A]